MITMQPVCVYCTTSFAALPQAPHKRFCSGKCRDAFWREQRQAARQQQALAEADARAKGQANPEWETTP